MMHLQIEPMLTSGLSMMKFVINHPTEFVEIEGPFFMGLCSFWIGLWVELVTIIYLSTLSSAIDVLTKQVCLAAVAKAGTFYAAALPKTSKFKQFTNIPLQEITMYGSLRVKSRIYKKNSCMYSFFYLIYRHARFVHVVLIYYFLPYFAVLSL